MDIFSRIQQKSAKSANFNITKIKLVNKVLKKFTFYYFLSTF